MSALPPKRPRLAPSADPRITQSHNEMQRALVVKLEAARKAVA